METEPLFIPFLRRHPNYQHSHHHLSSSSSTPPSLYPLPEHEPLTLPTPSPLTIPQPSSSSPSSAPLTPTELKNHLIFGSPFSSPSTNITIDALTLDSSTPCHHLDHSSPITSLISPSSFLFSKSNLHRSKTAPAISITNDLAHPHDSSHPKPSISSPYQVRQAAFLLLMYLAFGVLIYTYFQSHFDVKATHPVVDALYFCIVTMCTIGYGDITPNSSISKLFSILFVLVGFGFIDIFLSGMVGYVLDLQENLLLSTVKGGGKHELAKTYIFDLKKGRMRIRMKVSLALGVVILCIGVGTGVMHFVEHLGWLDSFYLSVMSVTTVGYGDHAFTSLPGRLFASVWLLVSTLAVARAFLYLVEARIDKRHRMMAKMVLGQDMTVAEFLEADIDNNGFVSKSEFVIYKLKEMGKIAEKDILQICNQFDRLDTGNCGKITLADLMENHH